METQGAKEWRRHMKITGILFGVLACFALSGAPASDARAQTWCGTDTLPMPGGWLLTACGTPGKRVSGFGTTMTDASNNHLSFSALAIAAETTCIVQEPFSHIQAVNGGYYAYYRCSKPGRTRWVQGAGNTATQTGVNTYGFAELFATHGVSCVLSTSPQQLIPGGMKLLANCSSPANYLYGAGSNLADAANNALGFATLSAEAGRQWTVDSIQAYPGRYEVRASRGAKTVVGNGSTVSAAAASALALASLIP